MRRFGTATWWMPEKALGPLVVRILWPSSEEEKESCCVGIGGPLARVRPDLVPFPAENFPETGKHRKPNVCAWGRKFRFPRSGNMHKVGLLSQLSAHSQAGKKTPWRYRNFRNNNYTARGIQGCKFVSDMSRCPVCTEIPKLRKKLQSVATCQLSLWRRCRARAGGASRRPLAFHRHASDFHNFYAETSLTFTIRRPRIGLNFEFKLQKSSCTSPPASPRQRWRFCLLTRLPRAAAQFCTPSNTQKHFLYVCLLAQLIGLRRFL